MTTRDLDPSAASGLTETDLSAAASEAASMAGLQVPALDVATITRIANELFKGMPGLMGPEGLTLTAAKSPFGSTTLPNESSFTALTSQLPGLPGVSQVSDPQALLNAGDPTGMPALPGVPTSALPAGDMLDWRSYQTHEVPYAAGWIEPLIAQAGAQAGAQGGAQGVTASKVQALPTTRVPSTSSAAWSGFTPELIPALSTSGGLFDAGAIRREFPILGERVHGKPLIWLDNAATTQKPQAVIDRISRFYERENSNIHRAAHAIAARASDAYEAARESSRRFLNAGSAKEIVFVRGTTEAINLVTQGWGRRHVREGDEIVLTWLEHHSNIVPWQLLAAEKGAKIRVAPVNDRGEVILEEYEKLLTPRTRVVSMTHVSNALGTVNPVREMTAMAHRRGARVLVDGAQAVSHMPVDVQSIDCDWYAFSGHKVFGPTGIGVLRGKPDAFADSPPWQGGGNMISDVTFEKTTYHPAPMRFEAGTGNIADAVGLGAALDWLSLIGLHNVARHEHELLEYGTRKLLDVPGLKLLGTAADKAGVLSFVLDGFKSEEVGQALDAEGIAVRAGHHCAQPILRRLGHETSVRPSLAVYNTRGDVDVLTDALHALVATRGRR